MTPTELSDKIADALKEVASWTADPRDWGRTDLDTAVEVWVRLDQLIGDLTILRRDHGVTLAHRVDDQQTVFTRDGRVTVHRVVPRNEAWDGAGVLTALAQPVVDKETGELLNAIPVDVARRVIPACGQGSTSSKWKVSELRQILEDVEQYRNVTYGDATIGRGPLPSNVRHARPRAEPTSD